MKATKCDICGNYMSEDHATAIILGIKLMGSPNYQDICQICTNWMIQTFDSRRQELKK